MPTKPSRMKRPATEPRWSGKRSVGLLVGLSLLLWAAIAGGVYLLVRLAL